MKALVAIAVAVFAFIVYAITSTYAEFAPMTAWCEERGGTIPSLWDDPMCITDDGHVLIAPHNANARWPE